MGGRSISEITMEEEEDIQDTRELPENGSTDHLMDEIKIHENQEFTEKNEGKHLDRDTDQNLDKKKRKTKEKEEKERTKRKGGKKDDDIYKRVGGGGEEREKGEEREEKEEGDLFRSLSIPHPMIELT